MSAKLVKNASYFSRFQTKFRRRREAKTEYVQRSALIQQDKTKYGAKKYRLVARITNSQIIAQIVTSNLSHDETLVQANSRELVRYGIKLGLTNYAAAYATGLLVARRLLKKLNLTEVYDAAASGSDDSENERRPFKVILDVGLRRTTTGARVFGVMKGAIDGGLFVPHSDKRFAGGEDAKKNKFFIFGGHVAAYMKKLSADEEAYKRQFGRYIKEGITADKLEAIYKNAHEKIRENPDAPAKSTKTYAPKVAKTPKMSFEERRKIINEKLAAKGLSQLPTTKPQ